MTKKIASLILIASIVLFASITVAFAWFTTSHVFNPDVSGGSLTGYFVPGGEGTKEKPYELNSWVHVYNLAWLQYMGELNKESLDEEGNTKISQIYFSLIDDINMEGIILPPIGTSDYPFVGHFDGNGHCISNLTVSNYLDSGENEFGIEKRPLSVTNIDGTTVSIIGFFGIVGAIDDDMKSKLIDDTTPDGEEVIISEKVNAVHDLFLDNITVRTETDESLIGLFAGYVNASVSNVGIGESSLCVGDNVQPLSAMEMEYVISSYSLIGKYDSKNVSWKDVVVGGSSGGNESGNEGWGGSMDMYNIIRRVSYMFTENIKKSPKNSYPVNFYNYGNIYYTYTAAANQQIAYIAKNSLIPINADTQTMFEGTETVYSNSYPTTNYYSTHNSELVASNNTGYIVGGATTASSAWIRMRISPMAGTGKYGGIYKSIGTSTTDSPSITRANLEMLTVDKDGNTYIIKDEKNGNAVTALSGDEKTYSQLGFKRYEDVAASFVNMLGNKKMVYGLRFWPQKNGITINDDGKIPSSIITTGNASFFGVSYDNYQFLDGAINFKVSQQGYITAVAGTYAEVDIDHSLFNLLEITRDRNNQIISARVIKKIWVKYSGNKLIDIQYNDDIADKTGYELVYDESKMNTLTIESAAYYFELPVKEGDYALCALSGTQGGAYLMYLDIGANGNESPDDTPVTETAIHVIEGVTFVDDAAIDDKSTEGYSAVFFSAEIKNNVTEHDGLQITFDRQSKTEMDYAVTDADNAFKVTSKKEDENLNFNTG